jgi:hypothetical protein
VDYDASWPVRAERLLQSVRAALLELNNSDMFVYEHIGSTAVPGSAAKPIVDLQVCTPSLPTLAKLAGVLAQTGFVPASGARPDFPGAMGVLAVIVASHGVEQDLRAGTDPGAQLFGGVSRCVAQRAQDRVVERGGLGLVDCAEGEVVQYRHGVVPFIGRQQVRETMR